MFPIVCVTKASEIELSNLFVCSTLKIKIKTVYCHVASTWNLDVVAYIIHTYIHTYIHIYINTHKYTYLHTYILTHNVNLGIQSLKYHNTPSLKYIYRYVKNKS